MKTKVFLHLFTVVVVLGLVGCETARSRGGFSKKANAWDRERGVSDADLPTPEWWYARRDYDPNYMHWGKMRHPDAASRSEKWILLNEDQCKAPHRSLGRVSADNGHEYRFYGFFMHDRGYEPASDELCPIFVLQRWELLNSPKGQAPTPQARDGSNEPPLQPEAPEQAAAPKPVTAQAVPVPPAKPAVKPAATATNAVKPKPVVKKTPVPAATPPETR